MLKLKRKYRRNDN